jgi:hypothetical protein
MNLVTFSTRFLLCSCLTTLASAQGVKLVHHPRQTNPDLQGRPRIVVEDPDAKHGTAQAAVPGKSKPGGTICSFYSYARPAGIYRVTWRVKVDDNTITDNVFSAGTGGGKIVLKGTDFKKPKTFQEFSYTAEKGEGGFFGVGSNWPGKGLVHVDSITVESEKLFTELEVLKKKGGLPLPEVWNLPKPNPPRLHIGKGLWWDFFHLGEVMAEMGGAFPTSSYYSRGQYGASLGGFPNTWQKISEHNLVVLANIDAPALRARGRALLEEYVKNGGGLLILGGPFAFQRGGYRYTALDRMLPCDLVGNNRLKADDLIWKPTDAASKWLPKNLKWELSPRAFYYHPMKPRPSSTVLVEAAGHPIIAVRPYGKGRVGVIAATVEGDPQNQLAFWEWGDLPRLIAAVSKWVMANPKEMKAIPMNEKDRQQLEALAMPAPDDKKADRERQLRKLLQKCRDKPFAMELLSTVSNSEGDPDHKFVKSVVATVLPFVDESFEEEIESLLEANTTGKAELGLRVLGRCASDEAEETLTKYLEKGASAFSSGEPDDLLGPAAGAGLSAELDMSANGRIKLAAVLAFGDLGEAGAVKALNKITREFSKKRQKNTEIDLVPDLNENIYQQSLASRCLLGDSKAVGPFLDAILKNATEIEEFENALQVMLINKDDKLLLSMREIGRIRIPVLRRRLSFCADLMRRMPGELSTVFAQEFARRNHSLLTEFAFAVLTPNEHRKLTGPMAAGMMPLIKQGTLDDLRMLGLKYILASENAPLKQELLKTLTELAGSTARSALFAIRATTQLDRTTCSKILKVATQHQSNKVRRLAGLYAPLVQ